MITLKELKQLRVEKGVTQRELAIHLGIRSGRYMDRETGKVNITLDEANRAFKFLSLKDDI